MDNSEARANPSSGRRRAAAWGAVFAYANAVLAVARNLLLVPVYLHFIPVSEYGAWLATGATLVQIVISDYGLAGVLMQRASVLHGAGASRGHLGSLIGVGLMAATLLAMALSVLSCAILPLLPARLLPLQSSQLANCFLLAVLANGLGIVGGTAQGFVRSLQRSILAGSATLVAEVVNIAASIALLVVGFGLYALAVGLVLRSLTIAVVLIGYLGSVYGAQLIAQLNWLGRDVRSLFVDSWHSFVLSLTMKLQTQGNTFFVGALLGPESAAMYGLTVRAHDTVLFFLSLVNNATVPSMAHLFGSGNIERFKALLVRIVPALALFAALGMSITAGINRSFVTLWVGQSVFAGQAVSMVAAIAVYTATIGFTGYDTLYAMGGFRYIARVYLATAVAHVLLLVGLLRIGLWAAPLVSVITSLLWGGLFLRRAAATIAVPGESRRRIGVDLVLIAACAALVALTGVLLPQPRNWPTLIAAAGCCGALFLVSVLAVRPRLRGVLQEELSVTMRSMLRLA